MSKTDHNDQFGPVEHLRSQPQYCHLSSSQIYPRHGVGEVVEGEDEEGKGQEESYYPEDSQSKQTESALRSPNSIPSNNSSPYNLDISPRTSCLSLEDPAHPDTSYQMTTKSLNSRSAAHKSGSIERPSLLQRRSGRRERQKYGYKKSTGFLALPPHDRWNFLMLVMLYFLQGIPMGLASGSVPFLLKEYVSYAQIGIFSLAIYPYSLKLLWSPIVDAVWSSRIGRRKSWILPIQTLSGLGMIWLGGRTETMLEAARKGTGAGIWGFTSWWFFFVFMCATQDIAVDGWALTVLSQENLSYASTAQTIGITTGQFLSYTVFLAFNSPDFANHWFRTIPQDYGVMSLGGYLVFWGWAYLVVTAALGVLKREDQMKNTYGVWDVYKALGGILKLRNIQTFIIIHLISKIGFQANDAVTNLKLIDKGFSTEDLALTVLIDFPFEILFGYYAGKWSQTYPPMHLWAWAFVGRLLAAVFAQFVIMIFPADGVTKGYLLIVIIEHLFSTITNTIMFVSISAFHNSIASSAIGGTYMTLLTTVSNLGGTFPRFFVLKFVDLFTTATCKLPVDDKTVNDSSFVPKSPFSCVLKIDKDRCTDAGGTCLVTRDGYYVVNVLCVAFGAITFWSYIRPRVMKLQALPEIAWRRSEK